jgi:hypothetical protein
LEGACDRGAKGGIVMAIVFPIAVVAMNWWLDHWMYSSPDQAG